MPAIHPQLSQFSRVMAFCVAALLGLAEIATAQTPPAASASIQATSTGPANTYSLTLSDSISSSSPVGTFWFAWIPGEDLLSASPTNVTSPSGWQAFVEGGYYGGYSIEWYALSPSSYLPAGYSLTGFGFNSPDTPDALSGSSRVYPGTPTLTSYMYSAGPFSDAGTQVVVSQLPTTPEPASIAATAPLAVLLCRRSRTQ